MSSRWTILGYESFRNLDYTSNTDLFIVRVVGAKLSKFYFKVHAFNFFFLLVIACLFKILVKILRYSNYNLKKYIA